jgi:hypothetical protein
MLCAAQGGSSKMTNTGAPRGVAQIAPDYEINWSFLLTINYFARAMRWPAIFSLWAETSRKSIAESIAPYFPAMP